LIEDPDLDVTVKIMAHLEILKLYGVRRLESLASAEGECEVVEILVRTRAEAEAILALPHDFQIPSVPSTHEPPPAPTVEVVPQAPIQEKDPDEDEDDDEPPPTGAFGDPLPRRQK
jgi:hypothetical protein